MYGEGGGKCGKIIPYRLRVKPKIRHTSLLRGYFHTVVFNLQSVSGDAINQVKKQCDNEIIIVVIPHSFFQRCQILLCCQNGWHLLLVRKWSSGITVMIIVFNKTLMAEVQLCSEKKILQLESG